MKPCALMFACTVVAALGSTTPAAAQAAPAAGASITSGRPPVAAGPLVRGEPVRSAPTGRRHGIGYGVIVLHDQVRDDLLAPLRWSGPGTGVRLSWDHAGVRTRHGLALALPVAVLENRFGHRGYGLAAEAEYAYGRNAGRGGGASVVTIGARAKWRMYGGYYESWDEEHLYWLTSSDLGPRLTWSRSLGRRLGLTVDASVPVVALVSRPPRERLNKIDDLTRPSFYFTRTHRRPTLAFPPEYAALQSGATVTSGVGRHRLVLRYELDAASYAEPARVRRVSNRLVVSHQLAF